MATSLAQRIAEAQASYHALMTGVSPRVVVDQNGERVEFVAANSAKLYAYIQEMQRQAGTLPTTSGGPIGFVF